MITPDLHDFARTHVPCSASVDLSLQNEGAGPLEIVDVTYESLGQMSVPLDAVGGVLPLILEPGESYVVPVTWAPSTAGLQTGTLEVSSDDPAGVTAAVQSGQADYAEVVTESFEEPEHPPLDILFLIDQSCSMALDNTDDLENGIPTFFATLDQVADWQLVQVTLEDGCANHGILSSSTPKAEEIFVRNAFQPQPVNDAFTERLLQHAATALALTGPDQCNEGALRDGASLHVIVASEEPEQSGQKWSSWVSVYQSYVGHPSLVKVSGILDVHTACGQGPDVGPAGYIDAVEATGGSAVNICQSDWSDGLTDLASAAVPGTRSYVLSSQPYAPSIVVEVNGVPTVDFDYDEDRLTVTVNEPPVNGGDLVEITYALPGSCS
ncbi:MAG: hypothetical protein KTR31_41785 [Myxococcales bacterium]|nr:hypothetical protein [Myxococcales bacterium]